MSWQRYCFLDSTGAPEGVSSAELARSPGGPWALHDCWAPERPAAWTPEHPVGERVAALIESGRRYPPALALARDETAALLDGHEPTLLDFEQAYGRSLRHHLERQHDSRHVMAASLDADDDAGRVAGQWYWLVGADASSVAWVSDDFHVRRAPLAAFDLTGAQLGALR